MGAIEGCILDWLCNTCGPFKQLIFLNLTVWAVGHLLHADPHRLDVPQADLWISNMFKRFECHDIKHIELRYEVHSDFEWLVGTRTLRALAELQARYLTHLLLDCMVDDNQDDQALLERIVRNADRFVSFATARSEQPPLTFAPTVEIHRCVFN